WASGARGAADAPYRTSPAGSTVARTIASGSHHGGFARRIARTASEPPTPTISSIGRMRADPTPVRPGSAGGGAGAAVRGAGLVDRRAGQRGDRGQDLEVARLVLVRAVGGRADRPDRDAVAPERGHDQRPEGPLRGAGPRIRGDVIEDRRLDAARAADDALALADVVERADRHAVGGREAVVLAVREEEEPGALAAQPADLGECRLADRREAAETAQRLGEVVNEVQLAIAVELLAGEAPLVVFAGGGVADHGGDGSGDAIALDPPDRLAVDEDREALVADPPGVPLEDTRAVG